MGYNLKWLSGNVYYQAVRAWWLNSFAAADSTDNDHVGDVAGNKEDAAATVVNNVQSLMAYGKATFLAVGGEAIQLRIGQSETNAVEEDAMVAFAISLMDVDDGPIAALDIDITGISQVMEKSVGGGAFAVGAQTQPVFATAAGLVYDDYRFLAAEWEIGDFYKLTVSGITCTIGTDTAYVKPLVWSGVVLEVANVEAKIDAIQSDLGDVADAATNDDMSDIATTSALAKLRLILNRQSPDAFTATVQGGAEVTIDGMVGALASYISLAGAAMSLQVNGNAARTNLEQALLDYFTVVGCNAANVFDPAINGGSQVTVEAAFTELGSLITGSTLNKSNTIHVVTVDGNLTADTAFGDASFNVFGDNHFNNNYVAFVFSATNATLGSMVAVTDFVSVGGVFTVDTVPGGNWAVGDVVLIAARGIFTPFDYLDHLLKLDGAAQKYPENCETDSIIAKILVKADPAVPDQFDNSTDSLEAISDSISSTLRQQADVAVTVAANIAAVNIFDLNAASTTYMINNLRIKAADPGAEIITLTLYELINDVSVAVDTFIIDTTTFGNYFSLYDMFSVHHLAGDDIQITVHASADNAYAITGQYQYAQATT